MHARPESGHPIREIFGETIRFSIQFRKQGWVVAIVQDRPDEVGPADVSFSRASRMRVPEVLAGQRHQHAGIGGCRGSKAGDLTCCPALDTPIGCRGAAAPRAALDGQQRLSIQHHQAPIARQVVSCSVSRALSRQPAADSGPIRPSTARFIPSI